MVYLCWTSAGQIFECLRETFHRHVIPWSTCIRFVQKQMKKKNFSRRKRLIIFAFSRACGRWGHVFATAPTLGPEKKSGHPLLLFMRVSMITNTWYICTRNIRIYGVSGICGGGNFRSLSWTSSYQQRDRNTRSKTIIYYDLLARISRASFVFMIGCS